VSRRSKPRATPPRRLPRGPALEFLLVVAAAWAARLLFLARRPDAAAATSLLYWGDTPIFVGAAQGLLRGIPFDSGIPLHPPGFFYLLAGWFGLTGEPTAGGFLLLKGFLALLGALTIGVFYLLARHAAGRRVARLALPAAIFSFGHYVHSTAINSEGLYLLLVLATLYASTVLIARLRAQPAQRRMPLPAAAGLLGALAAATALTRSEFLLTSLLIAALLLLAARRRRILATACYLLGLLLALTPWILRAHETLGAVNRANAARLPGPLPTWVPVTSGGPLNFATANNDFATGTFDTRLIDRLVPERPILGLDLADPAVYRLYTAGYAIGSDWMRAHPQAALALIGRKLAFAADAFALGYLQNNVPAGLTGERRPVDQFIPSAGALRWVHLVLALVGAAHLVRRWRRERAGRTRARTAGHTWLGVPLGAWLLLAHAGVTLAVIVAFFGYVRFGFLLAPLLWLLLGAAFDFLGGLLGRGRRVGGLSAGRIVALVVVLLLGVEAVATLYGPQRLEAAGSRLPGTNRINPDDRVRLRPSE